MSKKIQRRIGTATLDEFQKLSNDLSAMLLGYAPPAIRRKQEAQLRREKRMALRRWLGMVPNRRTRT